MSHLLIGLLSLLPLTPVSAQQGGGITEAEAVALAFPGCVIERTVVTLSPAQQTKARKDAGVRRVPAKIVRYRARKGGAIQGVAYVDRRRVRAQPQSLLVVVDAKDRIERVEILSWKEPRRYRLRPAFFAQFHGKKLDQTLRLRRGIRPVTGATLSAKAAIGGVRTVLAVHAIAGGNAVGRGS